MYNIGDNVLFTGEEAVSLYYVKLDPNEIYSGNIEAIEDDKYIINIEDNIFAIKINKFHPYKKKYIKYNGIKFYLKYKGRSHILWEAKFNEFIINLTKNNLSPLTYKGDLSFSTDNSFNSIYIETDYFSSKKEVFNTLNSLIQQISSIKKFF